MAKVQAGGHELLVNSIHLIGRHLLGRLEVRGTTLIGAISRRLARLVARRAAETTGFPGLSWIAGQRDSYHTRALFKPALAQALSWLELLTVSGLSYHIGERLCPSLRPAVYNVHGNGLV